MSNQEKLVLKKKYKDLKAYYKELKNELFTVPSDSLEHYNILVEMSYIGIELKNIKRALSDAWFRKNYVDAILGKVFLDEHASCRR